MFILYPCTLDFLGIGVVNSGAVSVHIHSLQSFHNASAKGGWPSCFSWNIHICYFLSQGGKKVEIKPVWNKWVESQRIPGFGKCCLLIQSFLFWSDKNTTQNKCWHEIWLEFRCLKLLSWRSLRSCCQTSGRNLKIKNLVYLELCWSPALTGLKGAPKSVWGVEAGCLSPLALRSSRWAG